ncbi:MAG: zinc-dependent metalloprotease [Actinomycetota bacterium]
MAADDVIDWNLAAATATRLVRPGPEVSRREAHQVVAALHELARAAAGHVRGYTGLVADPVDADGVVVVDRASWVRVNAHGFRRVLEPLTEQVRARRDATPGGALVTAVGARLTGVEAGAVLAFLSTKVLGQYELFGEGPGRLLLVAPNVVAAEREMGVDPRDFRMWVCLHEETHRVQFAAVPWLRAHVEAEIGAFLAATDLDPAALAGRLGQVVETVARVVRGEQASLLDAVQNPEQREVLDRLTALMSLLEGHADVVMDEVGPGVVPSVATIRERFQARRAGTSRADQLVRRLLGVDAKIRQYADGARFVRGVVDQVGVAGFNRVWTGPETLPTREELADPAAWVRRVHATPALPDATPEPHSDPGPGAAPGPPSGA